MFVGRERELKALERLYNEDKFQLIVVYGRRRVGKTTLLTQFCKEKPNIFFVADESIDSISLEKFSKEILKYFNLSGVGSFKSWEEAFLFLGKQALNQRIILVIDEFQYLVNSNKALPSIMQRVIDHELVKTKLFLIICGSYVSFMEREVLGGQSPLYGRRTAQFEILPLDFFDTQKFFPNYSINDKIFSYGILGGTPQYLRTFDPEVDVYQNIKDKILNKFSYLYDEPKLLLHQELREPAVYNSLLEVISKGSSKINEIATKTRLDTSKAARYLDILENLRIIKKIKPEPVGKSARSSIYVISDNFFRFWYRFVFENRELIEQELPNDVLEKIIKPQIDSYLGKIFEDVAIQYLKRLNQKKALPFVFEKIGKWWGNNPLKKREEEIDIVAYDKENILLGECKWQKEKVDVKVIHELIEKSSLFEFENKYYILFSKSGFTKEAINIARSSNVTLVELKDLEGGIIES